MADGSGSGNGTQFKLGRYEATLEGLGERLEAVESRLRSMELRVYMIVGGVVLASWIFKGVGL
jgi:hypothetical protein